MFWVVPTVMQAAAEVHETLTGTISGASPGAPGGVGKRWIAHRVPCATAQTTGRCGVSTRS
jgi:hypothetical protein